MRPPHRRLAYLHHLQGIGASTNRINMLGAGNQQQNQGQATSSTSNEPGGLETNQNHHDV